MLFVLVFVCSIFYLKTNQEVESEKEGFEANMHEILPVKVTGKSDDDYTLSVPNTILANRGQLPISFGGDIITKGKLSVKGSLLDVDGEANMKQGLTVKNVINAGQVYKNQHDALAPIGSVMMWMGASSPDPDGWVICNGKPRTNDGRFDRLLTLQIGTGTKSGSGSASYTPPDMTNRFLKGSTEAGTGVIHTKPTLKVEITNLPPHSHSGTTDSMNQNAAHSHGITDPGHGHTWNHGTDRDDWGNGDSNREYSTGGGQDHNVILNSNTGISINNTDINHQHTFTTRETGGGVPLVIPDPNYMTVHYILKY